jgi:hypothetical protein
MAFALRNLSVLAYANGFTLWLYKTASDDQRSVTLPGFFDDASDMLAGGDMMMVSASDGGRILSVTADGSGVRAAPLT